jgi:hypothetical protein
VRTPLADRLPLDSPELAEFDAALERNENRRSTNFSKRTDKAHQRRYRRYCEWCDLRGYQADPAYITTEKIREFTVYMVTDLRYAPVTIWQALRALEIYAERAGCDPLPSTQPARGVLDAWRLELSKLGVGKPPARYRRRSAA